MIHQEWIQSQVTQPGEYSLLSAGKLEKTGGSMSAYNAYSVNNISDTPNADGSFTVHFGGDSNTSIAGENTASAGVHLS